MDTTQTKSLVSAVDRFPIAPIPSLAAQRLDKLHHDVAIYFLGGTHIRNYVKPLGVTVYKVGASGCRDAERRAEDCRRKKYASILKNPSEADAIGRVLNKGHEWFLTQIADFWLNGRPLPRGMTIANGVIRVRVPTILTVDRIDRELHGMLAPRSFHDYLDSAEGQRRLKDAGYDPAARFHTSYTGMTTEPRLSLAQELYLIRPRVELRGFVDALAAMIQSLTDEASASADQVLRV